MEIEREIVINSQPEPSTAEDISFHWKPAARHEVEFNAFTPEFGREENQRTPAFYELLNAPGPMAGAEANAHDVRMSVASVEIEQVINQEEAPEAAQMFSANRQKG